MKLIVGLGNPGKEYDGTRHNVGFSVVDLIAEANGAKWKTDTKHHAVITKIVVDDGQVILAKPTTFMNLSGQAVSALAKYYKVKPTDILIIQDELDLLPGTFRFSEGGRAGGHHGLESIQELLPKLELARLRLGIGRPATHKADKDWVLTKPKGKELELMEEATGLAAEAAIDWSIRGLRLAMNKWN
ncbi:MAG: aminoacyl-tRNA hydrolase [Patescibacteria group bacterium]